MKVKFYISKREEVEVEASTMNDAVRIVYNDYIDWTIDEKIIDVKTLREHVRFGAGIFDWKVIDCDGNRILAESPNGERSWFDSSELVAG